MLNQQQLMNQLKKMQEEFLKIQEQLKQERVEGKAGEEKVKVILNGHMEVESVKIDPSLLNPEDAEILEDLLVLALRDGFAKVKELSAKRIGPFAGNLP